MASEPLDAVPAQIYVGDSLRVRFDVPGYSPDEWGLDLALFGPHSTSLNGQPDGSGWLVRLDADNSAEDWTPGVYSWAVQLSQGTGLDSERITVQTGRIEFLPNPSDVADDTEQRSFARLALEQLEAAIRQRKTSISFSVFGRTYTYETWEQMLSARSRLLTEVAAEDEQARLERGEPSRGVAWVRF